MNELLIVTGTTVAVAIISAFLIGYLPERFDKSRIARDLESKQSRLIFIEEHEFGPGFLPSLGGERIWKVDYIDKDGQRKSKFCKTAMFFGVYWTDVDNDRPE